MKTPKHIFTVLLALLLAVTAFPISTPLTAQAVETDADAVTLNPDYIFSDISAYIRTALYNTAEYVIQDNGSYACKTNISRFGLSVDSLGAFYHSFRYQNTDIFFLSNGYSYSYSRVTNTVTELIIGVNDTPNNIRTKIAEVDRAADKLVAEAAVLNTDLEKALYIHDALANTNQYSADVLNNVENYDMVVHNIYSALVNGETVCQGYSYAYKYILNRLGIMAEVVMSNKMGHMWNTVCLDGMWYFVDITWDDPTWDMIGRVKHDFFLNSSATATALYLESYNDPNAVVWNDLNDELQTTTNYDTTSTAYENHFFRTLTTPVSYHDGMWYYTTGNYFNINVMRTDDITSAEVNGTQLVNKSTEHWVEVNGAQGNYVYATVPSAVAVYGNRIYYSNCNAIYSADLDGSNEKTVFSYAQPDRYHCIYGVRISDGILYYSIENAPFDDRTVQSVQIPIADLENNRYVDEYGIVYTLNSNGTAVIGNSSDLPGAGYIGTDSELMIQSIVTANGTDYTITGIDKNAFKGTAATDITFVAAQPETNGEVFDSTTTVYYHSKFNWTVTNETWAGAKAVDLDAPMAGVTVKDLSLTVREGVLYGVRPETTVEEILTMLEGEYIIRTHNMAEVTDGYVGTGYCISRIVNGTVSETVTVVIPGDIISDGMATSKDIIALKLYINKAYPGYTYEQSLDVNGDGTVSADDIDALAELVFAS